MAPFRLTGAQAWLPLPRVIPPGIQLPLPHVTPLAVLLPLRPRTEPRRGLEDVPPAHDDATTLVEEKRAHARGAGRRVRREAALGSLVVHH